MHAMPPNLAQGADQGLEDVATLLRSLADTDPATALRSSEKSRRRRAEPASAIATQTLTATGPRTVSQSGTAPRAASAMPDRLATWQFEKLLRGTSNRF